jgi:hypothetical protein
MFASSDILVECIHDFMMFYFLQNSCRKYVLFTGGTRYEISVEFPLLTPVISLSFYWMYKLSAPVNHGTVNHIASYDCF